LIAKIVRRWLPLVLGLGLLITAIWLRGWLLIYLVQPFGLFLWAAYRLLLLVDQRIYWVVLLILAVIVLLRNLPGSVTSSKKYEVSRIIAEVKGVPYWQQVFAHNGSHKTTVRFDMQELLIAAIASQEHVDKPTAQHWLEQRSFVLPPSIYQFIYPSQPGSAYTVWHRINQFVKRKARFAEINQAVEETLHWLETYLEIPHDN